MILNLEVESDGLRLFFLPQRVRVRKIQSLQKHVQCKEKLSRTNRTSTKTFTTHQLSIAVLCFAKWHWKVLDATALVQGDLRCIGAGLKQNLGTAGAVREHRQVEGREETGGIVHFGLPKPAQKKREST